MVGLARRLSLDPGVDFEVPVAEVAGQLTFGVAVPAAEQVA